MRSARCVGVYETGEAKRGVASDEAPTGAAHCGQNLAAAGNSLSHLAQCAGSGVAHSGQNLARGGAWCWQRGHCMGPSDSTTAERNVLDKTGVRPESPCHRR
jgi:hypothetical protein